MFAMKYIARKVDEVVRDLDPDKEWLGVIEVNSSQFRKCLIGQRFMIVHGVEHGGLQELGEKYFMTVWNCNDVFFTIEMVDMRKGR